MLVNPSTDLAMGVYANSFAAAAAINAWYLNYALNRYFWSGTDAY